MNTRSDSALTRRDFAKASALAAGFAILSGKSGVAEDNSDTLKIGLIGCGGRGGGGVHRGAGLAGAAERPVSAGVIRDVVELAAAAALWIKRRLRARRERRRRKKEAEYREKLRRLMK